MNRQMKQVDLVTNVIVGVTPNAELVGSFTTGRSTITLFGDLYVHPVSIQSHVYMC